MRKQMSEVGSFNVDHNRLVPGLYVSRRDVRNDCTVTTFDLRFTAPNIEPPMDVPAVHTLEHLGATFLRTGKSKQEVVYFGPMGCRTGFCLLMFGCLDPEDVLGLVIGMCDFILDFEGDIPGASAGECGNYLEQNLTLAKYYASRYRSALLENPHTVYPE